MFGYEPCSCCKLYHLVQDLKENLCSDCSSDKNHNHKTQVPLSQPQYKKLCKERLDTIKHIIKPTLPYYPSDGFSV